MKKLLMAFCLLGTLVGCKKETPNQETGTSELEIEAPELETETSELEIEAPELETETSELEIEAPELETETPKLEVEVPNPETETPKLEVEVPNPAVETPKLEVEAPNPVVETPKLEVETPKSETVVENQEPVGYIKPIISTSYYNPQLTKDENVKEALSKAGVSNATHVLNTNDQPNKMVVLKIKTPLLSLSVHDLDQDFFASVAYDMDRYFIQNGEQNVTHTLSNIKANDVIVILGVEPDTMPCQYISWISEDKTTDYYTIQFNGKGE